MYIVILIIILNGVPAVQRDHQLIYHQSEKKSGPFTFQPE